MTYPTLVEIKEEIVPGDIWKLDGELEKILKRQISLLPSSGNSSKYEYRFPEDKASLRGFLDRLFARHFFQVQNAILQQDTFERLVSTVRRGNITLADIGCGPAVASMAILNLVSNVCCKLERNIHVNIILNDISVEALAVGRKMIDTYTKYLKGISSLKFLALETPFPDSMIQLRRISNMLDPYDICCLSYLLDLIREDFSCENIRQRLEMLAGFCKPTGFILNLQDKFRESFARRIGHLLRASVNKLGLRQRIYDSTNSYDEYSYDYFRIVFFPYHNRHGVETRFSLQRQALIPKPSQIARNGFTTCF